MKLSTLVITLLSAGMLLSCTTEEGQTPTHFSVSGSAQKGQFLKDSPITAYALNDQLTPTGQSFPSSITDDLGSFTIASEVSAPYLELRANGFYFVENTGETSDAPIYLSALASSGQKNVNINLLTTLTVGRIKQLFSEGKFFDQAKAQAESELLAALSFNAEDVTSGFEQLNISRDGYANALLLATSVMIQEQRTSGEVQKLVSDISSDFKSDGQISPELLQKIFDDSKGASVESVVENLIEYYKRNHITDYTIPPFYGIVNPEYATGFHGIYCMIDEWNPPYYNIPTEGSTWDFLAISAEDFEICPSADWLSGTFTQISTQLYRITLTVSPNPSSTGREGTLTIKSKSGEDFYTYTAKQSGDAQLIYIASPGSGSRADAQPDGGMVNVNGTDYPLVYHPNYDWKAHYFVEVPKSSKGYGISNAPDFVVAGRNGDVLCATLSYNSNVDEHVIHRSDIDLEWAAALSSSARVSVSEECPLGDVPAYAALISSKGAPIPSPTVVQLEPTSALLSLEFVDKVTGTDLSFASLQVEVDADGFLSGEVTTCMYPGQSAYDPTYVVPRDEYRYRSNQVEVRNTNGDNRVAFLVHPQTVHRIKATAYDENGGVLFQQEQQFEMKFHKGKLSVLRFSL